jgi:hypothetical protein
VKELLSNRLSLKFIFKIVNLMIKVLCSMDFKPFVETIENLPTGSKTVNRVRGQKLKKSCRHPKWMVPKEKNQSIETIWLRRPLLNLSATAEGNVGSKTFL